MLEVVEVSRRSSGKAGSRTDNKNGTLNWSDNRNKR